MTILVSFGKGVFKAVYTILAISQIPDKNEIYEITIWPGKRWSASKRVRHFYRQTNVTHKRLQANERDD